MNKKFSTLAALLLASGAGYTLVQAALADQQVGFKPGVKYTIGKTGQTPGGVSVVVEKGGVKIGKETAANGEVWSVAKISTGANTTFGLKFENKYLSKDFGLTEKTNEALVIELGLQNAVKVGDKYLFVEGTTTKSLKLGDTPSLYLFDDQKAVISDLGLVQADAKSSLTQVKWIATSLLMKGGTVVTDATYSTTLTDNTPWVLAAGGKLSTGTGDTYLTVASVAGNPATAGSAALAGTELKMAADGRLMMNTLYLEYNGAATECNTVSTPAKALYLYVVDATGNISTSFLTTMPTTAGGKYMIAPALQTITDADAAFVHAIAPSTTFATSTTPTEYADWTVEAAKNDSMYIYLEKEGAYLDYTVTAGTATLGLSDAPNSKFLQETAKLGSKYGDASYMLNVIDGGVTFGTTAGTMSTDIEEKVSVAAITSGTSETTFAADSTLTIATGATDGDYLYFMIDGKYVSVAANNTIELLDAKPTTNEASRKATWEATAKGYKSVYVEDKEDGELYLSVAVGANPFSLKATGSTFAFSGNAFVTGSTNTYLVKVTNEGVVSYVAKTSTDVTMDTPVLMDQKLSLTIAKAPKTVQTIGNKRIADSNSSKYYLLSDGENVINSKGEVKAAALGDESNPEYLWKMSESLNANGSYSYAFTNLKTSTLLTVDTKNAFVSTSPFKYKDAEGLVLRLDNRFMQVSANKLVLGAAGATVEPFALYEAGTLVYPAKMLNDKLGNSFILGTTPNTTEESALINNTLRAVWLSVDGKTAQYFVVANSCELADNQGEDKASAIIVHASMFGNADFVAVSATQYLAEVASTGKGFAYTTVKGSTLFDFTANKAKAGIEKAQFNTGYSISDNVAIKDVNSLIITQRIDFGKGFITVRPQVMKASVKNSTTNVMEDKFIAVTMNTAADVNWSVINFNGNNGVAKTHFDDQAYNAKVGNTVGEKAGWIYGPSSENNTNDLTVDPAKSNINLAGAEGQFVIRYETVDGVEGFWMYNRESTNMLYLGRTIFEVKDANNVSTNKYYLTSYAWTQRDTIELTPTDLCHARLGGYGHSIDTDASTTFDKVNLAKTAFRIGIKNGSFDGIAYINNSSVHNNQLSVNIKDNDGLRFFLVPTDTVAYGLNYSNKAYWEVVAGAAKDSLYRVSYALQERTTKRFVGFNTDGKLELNAKITKATDAQKFFFKEKGDGKFVIVTDYSDKIFANIGDASLHSDYMYKGNIADEFVLDTITAPKYADILKNSTNKSDTTLVEINLYSVENLVGSSSYLLTPGANDFLVEGVPAPAELKATGGKEYPRKGFDLVVDTAYVNRLGNTMPMYYLTMNGTLRKDSVGPLHKGDKDENGHAIDCKHFAGNDTVVGKYLFAMYDSTYFGKDKNIKPEDNCYHYTNTEHFARLRFVDAKRVNDTVIINSGIAAKDTLKAGVVTSGIPANRQYDWLNGFAVANDLKKAITNHQGAKFVPEYDNFGLFAFEINPANDKEYAIYSPATGLYISYINGNVVLAPQASYYTMTNSENGTLVDNETIGTTEISVIAGNGSVSIQNAEGKRVAISNILGQTLVNTTITSDNATISVPAGIVVVAVEGEVAVKAIIK